MCHYFCDSGYGFSSKPDPGPWKEKNAVYNFETWSEQVLDFAKEVAGDKVFLVCNSVGGLVGLQAGVDAPDQVHEIFSVSGGQIMLAPSHPVICGARFFVFPSHRMRLRRWRSYFFSRGPLGRVKWYSNGASCVIKSAEVCVELEDDRNDVAPASCSRPRRIHLTGLKRFRGTCQPKFKGAVDISQGLFVKGVSEAFSCRRLNRPPHPRHPLPQCRDSRHIAQQGFADQYVRDFSIQAFLIGRVGFFRFLFLR